MSDSEFRKEIESVINKHCRENDSNTPDFILANYLLLCFNSLTLAMRERDRWYGVHLGSCLECEKKHLKQDRSPKSEGDSKKSEQQTHVPICPIYIKDYTCGWGLSPNICGDKPCNQAPVKQ